MIIADVPPPPPYILQPYDMEDAQAIVFYLDIVNIPNGSEIILLSSGIQRQLS